MNTKQILISILVLVGFITFLGLFLDIMAPDGALYASIAKTMYTNNDFTNLFFLDKDWLDKPHLPFWLTALSFKIFGVNSFAYKLPAVFVFLFGAWITSKFTKENYNKETAILAIIILLTSLHSVLSNFDVRAEPFLTGFIIASVYYFHKYLKFNTKINLVLGCLFAAFSLMTKGTFTLIPIAAALGGELIIKKNWKQLCSPIWLVALILMFLFTLPELYTLYLQFDAHPEKTVFGENGISGIKFFLWDSQFGRFFNTGPIVNYEGNIFFFIHTILWTFLPWSVLFYLALFFKIKRNFKTINKNEEFYSVFSTLTIIFVFSISKFQLSHYTNIVFPFMAILTADFIYILKTHSIKLQKTYTIIQLSIAIGILLLIPIVYYIMIDILDIVLFLMTILCALIIYFTYNNQTIHKVYKVFITSSVIFLTLYTFLFTSFYPTLLKYQGGVYAAQYANNTLKKVSLIKGDIPHFCFEFYNNLPTIRVSPEEIAKHKNEIIYLSQHQLDTLKAQEISYSIIKEFQNFRITKLTFNFVNKATRNTVVDKTYLVAIN